MAQFVDTMDSKRFANPQTRVDIFEKIQTEQKQLYEQRTAIIKQLAERKP